jgi:hypothetical protein
MPRCSNTRADGVCYYVGPCLECATNRSRLKAAATVPTRADGVLFIDWWATVEGAYNLRRPMWLKKLPGRMSSVDCYKAGDSPASYLDRLHKGLQLRHNHVTRDIKPEGSGCPGCDNYHQKARERAQRQQHTCTKNMSSMNCSACNRGVPYPHETVEEILDRMAPKQAKPDAVACAECGAMCTDPTEISRHHYDTCSLYPDNIVPAPGTTARGPVNNPEAMHDGEILHERQQISISLQCGPGSTHARELRARDQDLLRELQRRSHLTTEAAEREAKVRRGSMDELTREGIVLLELSLEKGLSLLRHLKARLF